MDEQTIVLTLKDPDRAIQEAQRQTDEAKEDHAQRGKSWRIVGMGLGAVAGGVLVGVTGGLAAPLVGAGVTTILTWFGVGGTAAGLLASGLAGSSVVCGALFGAYGARSTAGMVERHTREIRDLEIIPVRAMKDDETLAVRLCVSGWLSSPEDVTAPWTVFGGDDTFALQWVGKDCLRLGRVLILRAGSCSTRGIISCSFRPAQVACYEICEGPSYQANGARKSHELPGAPCVVENRANHRHVCLFLVWIGGLIVSLFYR